MKGATTMLTWDESSGTLSYGGDGCSVSGWSFALEAGDVELVPRLRSAGAAGGSTRLAATIERPRLDWDIEIQEVEGGERLLLRSTITNRSGSPVRLGRVTLLRAAGVRFGAQPEGGEADGAVVLSLTGTQAPRRIYRLADPDCPRESRIKAQFWDRRSARALQLGFVSFGRADTLVSHSWTRESGLAELRAWCDFAGWTLAPGASTEVELFTVAIGRDPCAQLESWADLASPLCGARRWEEPPVGWLGWAWVDGFNVERYEDVVLRNAAAIARRLTGFGVRYIWVSIGNLRDGLPGNWLEWNDRLFPSGPEKLVRELAKRGITLGLWCGAFWMCDGARPVQRLRPAFLHSPDGSPLVAVASWSYGTSAFKPKEERPCIWALDPTHPETRRFLTEVFTTYRRWGVRYYMIDFLNAAAGALSGLPYASHHDAGVVAGPEVLRSGLRTIREATGDDTYLLASSGPTLHTSGFVDGVRTGNDFGEGRPMNPGSSLYPATSAINSGAVWSGPQHALLNQATNWYTHRKLYLNDSGNVLTVDRPLPLSDAQVHATIHALSGGPTMLGDDLETIDDERLALIKRTLPRSREVARPVNLFDAAHPRMPSVFHRRIELSWGSFDVVAVYNFAESEHVERVSLRDLRLDPGLDYLVWEFWNCEYMGRVNDALLARVPPRSVKVYRIVRDPGSPVLLGSDMHLLMGEMEVRDCRWDPRAQALSGAAARPGGERGSLYVRAPATVRVAEPRGLYVAKDARDKSLVIRIPLSFAGGLGQAAQARFSVAFAPLDSGLDTD